MDIAPSTPFDRIDREKSFRPLFGVERAEKIFGCFFDGACRHTRLLDRKEARDYGSVGGNALKAFCRCGEGFLDIARWAALGVQWPCRVPEDTVCLVKVAHDQPPFTARSTSGGNVESFSSITLEKSRSR